MAAILPLIFIPGKSKIFFGKRRGRCRLRGSVTAPPVRNKHAKHVQLETETGRLLIHRNHQASARFKLKQQDSRTSHLSNADQKSAPTNEPTEDSVFVRARLLSRVVTEVFDEKLRPFGISSTQFSLLAAIGRTEPATRSDIARLQHLDRSTLTRNLRAILSEGWVEEVREMADGRSRPIALSTAGRELLLNAEPAWLAAQAQAEALLGQDATVAVISSADRILNSPGIPHPGAEFEAEDDPAPCK
jgi:DNA-binding MarR family transcriptional regulator